MSFVYLDTGRVGSDYYINTVFHVGGSVKIGEEREAQSTVA